jgi:hypothetical protein
MTTSALCAGTILASNFNDLQVGFSQSEKMHSGAPGSNIEIMLKGEKVEEVETGGDPTGKVSEFANGTGQVGEILLKPVCLDDSYMSGVPQ